MCIDVDVICCSFLGGVVVWFLGEWWNFLICVVSVLLFGCVWWWLMMCSVWLVSVWLKCF